MPTREEIEEMLAQAAAECTCAVHYQGTRTDWLKLKLLELMKSACDGLLGSSVLAAAGGELELGKSLATSAYLIAKAAGALAGTDEAIMSKLDSIMADKAGEYAEQLRERLNEQWEADGTPKEIDPDADHEHS